MTRAQRILKKTSESLRQALLAGLIGMAIFISASNTDAQQVSQLANTDRTPHILKASGNEKGYRLQWVFLTAREEPGGETGLSYKEYLSRFDAVFLGHVTEKIERLKEDPCGSTEEMRDWDRKPTIGFCGVPVKEQYYVFSVEKVFKGVKSESVEMFYEDSNNPRYCNNTLQLRFGDQFLVYGMKLQEKKQLVVSCDTMPAENADVEMMFLTAVANGVDEARIYAVLPRIAKTHSRGKARADALIHWKNAPPEMRLPGIKDYLIFALRDSYRNVRELSFRILASDKYLFKPGVLGKLISVVGNKYSPISSDLIQVLAASASRDEKTISKIEGFLKQQKKLMERYRNKKPLDQFEYYQERVRGIQQLLELIKQENN